MAKGNYTALQQLKPAEIKVGEFYDKWVDGYVKRGEAGRAAQAKLEGERKKEVGERFGAFKIDAFSTLPTHSDFAQQTLVDTASYIGTQRMKAEQDPANATKYLMLAENAYNDYRGLAATFGSKDFIEKANAKQQALASNDVFSETDNNEQLAMLASTIPEYRRDPVTGRMQFGLPKNGKSTDDEPLEWKSAGATAALWTSPDEINLLRSNKSNGNNGFLDKQVFDVAKQMTDEYSRNYDGNRTNAKKWFSENRGNQWFDSTFGEFNPNNIPPVIRQYAKSVLRKSINGDDAESVYQEAKSGIINNIASLVATEEKVETKDSAIDTAIKQQSLINAQLEAVKKRQDIANPGRGSGGSSGSGDASNGALGDGTLSVGNVVLNVKTKSGGKTYNNHYQTKGLSYYVSGNTNDGRNSRIGVTTYWNPNGGSNGKGGFSFAMNIPSKDGKEVVIEGVNGERAKQILASNKVKDPQNILATMAAMAEANNLKGVKPKGIGRGFGNYAVDFSTEKTESDGLQ